MLVTSTGVPITLPPLSPPLPDHASPLVQVTTFTFGYVMDRRCGNTQGLGGAFGFLWAIGVPLPYPEGRPWGASLQQRVGPWGRGAGLAGLAVHGWGWLSSVMRRAGDVMQLYAMYACSAAQANAEGVGQ